MKKPDSLHAEQDSRKVLQVRLFGCNFTTFVFRRFFRLLTIGPAATGLIILTMGIIGHDSFALACGTGLLLMAVFFATINYIVLKKRYGRFSWQDV